jgi:ribosomal biogenesis protein LAS1
VVPTRAQRHSTRCFLFLLLLFLLLRQGIPVAKTRPVQNQVQAYQVRGRVPHAIDSTAQLTTAVLLDIPLASTLHVRLAYSTAICRFVNGLLDPAQQSRFALPMHILARSLNLPAPFVEARHAATHETLPSLALLRSLALRALEWLRENYWAAVGTGVRELVGDMVLLGRARAAVKAWRKFRRANPVRELNTGDSSVESREARAIILECAGVCTEYIEEDGLQAVVTALLEEKALIPSGAEKIKMMKGAKLLWVPFLAAMEKESGGFVEAVVGGIVEILCTAVEFPKTLLRVAKATRNVQLDHRHQENEVDEEYEYDTLEVMLKWVEYIYSPKQRVPGGLGMGLSVEGLIKQLLLRPNEWYSYSLRLILRPFTADKTHKELKIIW